MALAALAVTCSVSCSTASKTTEGTASPSPPAPSAQAAALASAPAFAGKSYPSQGHKHLETGASDDFKYNSYPPTSGPHREIFNDAFASPVALPKYVQVHLLEHGNVLLQYNCTCPDVAAALAQIASEYDNRLYPSSQLQPLPADVQGAEEQGYAVIVAPYPAMKAKITLTAWTKLATLESVDKQKIVSFINLYLHNGANASQ